MIKNIYKVNNGHICPGMICTKVYEFKKIYNLTSRKSKKNYKSTPVFEARSLVFGVVTLTSCFIALV